MPGKIRLVQTTDQPVSSDDIMNSIKKADPFYGPIGLPADQQFIFESFCVDEEKTKLGIQMPLKNNPYGLSSLALEYLEDPDSGSKNVKRTTPEVRKSNLNVEKTPYEYAMYTYKIAPKPGQLSDDERRWVFTGSGKLPIGLMTNIFIPVDQLRIRLIGTAQERRIAYALDWLTYLAYVLDMNGVFKPEIPKNFDNDLAKLIPTGYTAKKIFTGAHLGLRNSIGGLSDGSRFLGNLLEPTTDDRIDNLSVFIFKRWCITFVYVPPDDMWPKVSKAKAIKAVNLKLGSIAVSKIEKEQLFSAWKTAIKGAHETAKWQANDPNDDSTLKEVPSPMCKTMEKLDKPQDYVFLGSHPQGFYGIYVSKEDLATMEKWGYVYNKALDFPTRAAVNVNLSTNVNTWPATHQSALKTKTLISKSTLAAATAWPRFETQNTVMNYSANTAAQNIWSNTVINNGSFEWLHRSAYSYGGIDKLGPDSSQIAYNLVLGTYEANTAMIRHEEYLKRYVRYKSDDFKLYLFTTLNTQTAWGDKTWSWLIKDLTYKWEFPLFGDPGFVLSTGHSFPVLSRQIPSRFEFDMDEQFDVLWMSETVVPSGQDFKTGMLLYLAGGGAMRPLTWT